MQFRVRSIIEYPLEYNHDTSQLCRTGHNDVSLTRMTTLIFMRLYGSVEEVVIMCLVYKIWQLFALVLISLLTHNFSSLYLGQILDMGQI